MPTRGEWSEDKTPFQLIAGAFGTVLLSVIHLLPLILSVWPPQRRADDMLNYLFCFWLAWNSQVERRLQNLYILESAKHWSHQNDFQSVPSCFSLVYMWRSVSSSGKKNTLSWPHQIDHLPRLNYIIVKSLVLDLSPPLWLYFGSWAQTELQIFRFQQVVKLHKASSAFKLKEIPN